MSYIRAPVAHRPTGIYRRVPARAGFPHARPPLLQGKIQSIGPNGPAFHPHRPAPRVRRAASAARWPRPARRVRPPPEDLQNNTRKRLVRLADTRPKVSNKRLAVPLALAPCALRRVLTWPVITASRCCVRIPDITGESHFQAVPRLALDTRRRNGHASDQAQ